MAEENITTKFRVDVSDLKKGIQDANKSIKTATAEFKNATAGMDKWSDSVDGLSAKIKEQESVLDAEKAKLTALQQEQDRLNETNSKGEQIIADLNSEYENAVSVYGSTSDEAKKYAKQLLDAQKAQERNVKAADDLNTQILNQDTKVKTTERALKHYNSSLDDLKNSTEYLEQKQEDLTDAYNDAVSAYGKNSDEAKQLKAELKDVAKQMKTAGKDADDLGDSAEDAGDGFTVAKGAISGFIANGLTALTSAIGNAVSGLSGLASESREYRTIMGSLESASERAGYSTEQTAETYSTLNGVLGDTQSAATTTSNLQAIGLEQSKLQDVTNGVIGAWATYGDSIPIDGLAEATNETIKVGQVTGGFADMLNWAGESEDDFNEKLAACSDETERAQLVTDTFAKMGLTDAGKAWQENNKSIVDANNAQSEYEKQTAKLGEIVEPITAKVRDGFAQIVEKIVELVSKADFQKVSDAIDTGFKYLIDTVIPKIIDGFTWIIDNKDTVIAGIAGIGAAFLAWKIVTIIQSVTTALKGMTIAQAALNLVMKANPIGIVVSLIAGLVAAFVVLWNKSDAFREFFINLWDTIKNFVGTVVGAISDFFVGLWDGITAVFSGTVQWFSDIFTGVWDAITGALSAVGDFFVGIWDTISGIFVGAAEWFNTNVVQPIMKFFRPLIDFYKQIFNTIKETIRAVFEIIVALIGVAVDKIKKIWSVMTKFFSDLWNGIKKIFSVVADWFKDIFSKAWEGIKKIWSVVVAFFKGIWDGIKAIFSAVVGFYKTIFTTAWNVIKTAFSAVSSFFTGVWNKIKSPFVSAATWFKNIFTTAWTAIKNVFSKVGDFFGGIWKTIKSKFTSIGTKVAEAIGGAFKSAINAVIATVEGAINLIPNAINGAIDLINKLPGVDIGKIPTVSLPRLAKGGIVNRSTLANIGENGEEAIIPLERNKGGLKKIAGLLAQEMKTGSFGNSGTTVGGNTVYNFNQTNNSPKPLSRYEIYRQSKNLFNTVKGV